MTPSRNSSPASFCVNLPGVIQNSEELVRGYTINPKAGKVVAAEKINEK